MRTVLVVLTFAVAGAACAGLLLRRADEPRTETTTPTGNAVTIPPPRPTAPSEPSAPFAAAPDSRVAAAPFVAREDDDATATATTAEPECDEPGPYVRMRLLLPGGNPLPSADVRLYVGADEPEPVVTSASRRGGRWTFPRATLTDRVSETHVVRVVTDYRPWTARVVVPAAPADADVDLGDVPLVATPVVCAGVVVGPEGEPVVDARLVLEAPTPLPPGALLDGPIPDGTFRYFAETPPERVRLSATHAFRAPKTTTVDVPVGAKNFRLVLGAATGVVRGRVLMADEHLSNLVGGYVVEATGADGVRRVWPPPSTCGVARRLDAPFEIVGLPVGKARVEVLMSDDDVPVAVVEDVPVPGGDAAEDPRLDPIDLRGRVKTVVVTVVDPDGAPVADVAVAEANDGALAAGLPCVVTDAAGTVRFVAARLPVEIGLRPPWRENGGPLLPRTARLVALQERVVLEAALDVRITVAAGVHAEGRARDAAAEALLARLRPILVAPNGDAVEPMPQTIREAPVWQFCVERPETYVVRWTDVGPAFEWDGGDVVPNGPVDLSQDPSPIRFEVLDVATPQRFTATPSAYVLRELAR